MSPAGNRLAEARESDQSYFAAALPSGLVFWLLAFVYACLMALMLQKLVLPLMPSLHAGHGLLFNDALLYHNMAEELADRIDSEGWGAWELLPFNGVGANVGVLGALYALLGPDPAWFIPINAAAHATGGLMLYKIGSRLWPGRIGAIGGFSAGVMFIVFPSSLQWYGQNLKDAFAIAGILMLLFAQMRLYDDDRAVPGLPSGFLLTATGAVLLAGVRPYFPALVLVGFGVASAALMGVAVLRGKLGRDFRRFLHGFALLAVLGAVVVLAAHSRASTSAFEGGLTEHGTGEMVKLTGWEWHESDHIPSFVEAGFRRASAIRAHFVGFNRLVNAGSGIDENRLPQDVFEALAYLPRASVIGLLSPFPASWAERTSVPRLVAAMETAIWYLFLPGVVFICMRRPSPPLVFGLIAASVLLTIQAYVYPNVGNLYRQRFAFWMFVLAVGAVGWVSLLLPKIMKRWPQMPVADTAEAGDLSEAPSVTGGNAVIAAGSLVIGITLLCYLGFMARDLMLVRIFGMSTHLDGYFFAAMLPMFFVACLTMPMADAFMRPFVESYFSEGSGPAAQLARRALWHGLVGVGVLSLALGVFAAPLMRLGMKDPDPAALHNAATMFRWFLPLLLLSPWTVIGNTILNGLQDYRTPAIAQLIVPAITIAAVGFAPIAWGVYPAIFGMVAGAILNLVLVLWRLRKVGIALWPEPSRWSILPRTLIVGYRRLAVAGLVGTAATPLGYTLAGMVGEGGISTWALATKMTTLFTGLASVGIASVVLPRLARVMRERLSRLRSHFLLLLFGGNWIGGALAALICLFSLPIAAAMVGGVAEARIETLAIVIRIGALQLPLVIAYTVIMKTSAVIGTSARILVGSLLALLTYLGLAYVAAEHFGVLGIAASALAAGVVSTLYLAVVVRQACGFGFGEVAVLALGWLVWAGISLAAVSSGVAAILCALIGLSALAWIQFRVLSCSDAGQDLAAARLV